jgi:DNA repair exonuclease SbcCD ATPase subunit
MKLLRIAIENWRSYRGGPHIVEFDSRATLIEGPNERGKSTLFEAVRRALFDKSRTTAGWVERLIPYGSGATPKVTLELEHSGRTLRIEKQFGARGSATLDEWRDGMWVNVAVNEEAEEQLLSILGAEACGKRTGSTPECWGPFQWLFVPQDDRDLPDSGSDATGALGLDRAGVSLDFEQVRTLVQAEHDRSFTSKGQFARQSDVKCLEAEIKAHEEVREGLAAEVERFATIRCEYEEIQERLPGAREDAELARQELETVETEVVDLSGAQGQLEAIVERRKTAYQQVQQSAGVLRERWRREKEQKVASDELESARAAEAKARIAFEQTKNRLALRRAEVTDLGDLIATRRRDTEDANLRLRALQARDQAEDLGRRLENARALDAKIRELTSQLTGETPAASMIAQAEELFADAQAKRAVLPTLALRVRRNGAPAAQILIDGYPLEGNEGLALSEVLIETKGGSVAVEGDMRQAQQFADDAREKEANLAELLSRSNVQTVQGLRTLREQGLAREAEVAALRKERQALDTRSVADLEAEIARLVAEAIELEKTRSSRTPDTRHDRLTQAQLKEVVGDASAETAAQEETFGQLRAAREQLVVECDLQQSEAQKAAALLQTALARVDAAQTELDRHRDEHGSTDQCRARHDAAEKALAATETEEAHHRRHLEELSKRVSIRRQTAKQKADRLTSVVHQLQAQARQLEETLEREAAAGAYSRLADLDRKLESERIRLERLRERAEAIRRLNLVMGTVRTEAVSRVVAPIKGRLDDLLAAVTQGRYCLAELDEQLQPRRLDGGEHCAFEDGSQGLRELVATLIRMSVAAHLAESGPQTVILDDPCVHVSRERTARLVELLNQVSERSVQVVVFTHRPYEFAGLIGNEVQLRESIKV